jgi:hypothetical protein
MTLCINVSQYTSFSENISNLTNAKVAVDLLLSLDLPLRAVSALSPKGRTPYIEVEAR